MSYDEFVSDVVQGVEAVGAAIMVVGGVGSLVYFALAAIRADARRHEMNVIYGTIRLIERDDESMLAWAREPWACVVINLHVDHSPEGLGRAQRDFRRLIDSAAELGGSYYLTYHRWATRSQVERCHPRMREFLARKRAYDPRAMFTSDWYTSHVRLLG